MCVVYPVGCQITTTPTLSSSLQICELKSQKQYIIVRACDTPCCSTSEWRSAGPRSPAESLLTLNLEVIHIAHTTATARQSLASRRAPNVVRTVSRKSNSPFPFPCRCAVQRVHGLQVGSSVGQRRSRRGLGSRNGLSHG